ncbi:hypothetical protein FRC16_008277 [Serendipita sp. 398]|nr:hypothetical protein FRC16_008277 [Serendipita sp. 398]
MSAAGGSFTTFPSGTQITDDGDDLLITLDDPSTTTTSVSAPAPSQSSAILPLDDVASSSPVPLSSAAPSPATATAIAGTSSSTSSKPPVGSIVGLVFGLLILIGLVLFGVRYYFIRKRESKTTAARARVSRLVISAPKDFQHVQSGAHQQLHGNMYGTRMGINAHTTPVGSSQHSGPTKPVGGKEADVDSPFDRIKQKYSFDLNQLETGLSNHMETMKSSRKAAPAA